MEGMTVWTVVYTKWDDSGVIGIFSTFEKAVKFAHDEYHDTDVVIEEWTIDKGRV